MGKIREKVWAGGHYEWRTYRDAAEAFDNLRSVCPECGICYEDRDAGDDCSNCDTGLIRYEPDC